jgi:hypothetical protein
MEPHQAVETASCSEYLSKECSRPHQHSTDHCNTKDYDARAAIALNNTGVSLMERGAYQLAVETFKDSVAVMQRVLGVYPAMTSPDVSNGMVCEMLGWAETRLASASAPGPASSICINRLSFDGSALCGLNFDMDHILSKTLWMPVSIEPSSFSGLLEDSTVDVDFRFAVVLYNLALAYLCLVQTDPSARTSTSGIVLVQHLLFTARQLLQMVLEILNLCSQSTACCMWTEGARLAITCLSLAHLESTMTNRSNYEHDHASFELSLAISIWCHWISRTGRWLNDETPFVLDETTVGVSGSEHTSQLRVRQQMSKSPAA